MLKKINVLRIILKKEKNLVEKIEKIKIIKQY